MNTREFKQALRNGPYAWPGGYPVYFVMSDGAALSFDAAKDNAKLIIRAIRDNSNCGWRAIAADINWEDTTLYCDHTSARIECAYSED